MQAKINKRTKKTRLRLFFPRRVLIYDIKEAIGVNGVGLW